MFVVTGHRWAQDGWYVLSEQQGEDGKAQERAIPYTQVTDEHGMPLYEEREFEEPVVQRKEEAQPQGAEDENGEQPSFSRTRKAAAPLTREQRSTINRVKLMAASIRKVWQNAPAIEVVWNAQDERVPQVIRDYDAAMRSQGAEGDAEAVYHKGKVYVFASQVSTPRDMVRVVAHEVLGHHGLRGAFGRGMARVLNELMIARRAEVVQQAREYGLLDVDKLPAGVDAESATDAQVWAAMSEHDRQQAAEEVLAHLAETYPQLPLVRRAIAAIRTWLRQHVQGFDRMGVSDDEIVRSFILPAREWVQRGMGVGTAPGTPLFRRAWHGTPYGGIEKEGFKLHAIGSGEGQQIFGWGMYFAGNRVVAEGQYRDRLSPRNPKAHKGKDGKPGQLYQVEVPEDDELLDWDKPLSEQPEKIREALSRMIEGEPRLASLREIDKDAAKEGQIAHLRDEVLEMRGTREVATDTGANVKAFEFHNYLQDFPVFVVSSAEDAAVKQSLPKGAHVVFDAGAKTANDAADAAAREYARYYPVDKYYDDNMLDIPATPKLSATGKEIYQALSKAKRSAKAASRHLLKTGIHGLRYLDGMSRGKGEGTHNYVIWDEALLTPEQAAISVLDTAQAAQFEAETDGLRFMRTPATQRKFEQRIAALLKTKKAQGNTVVLDRSDMLGLLGYPDVPLLLAEAHVLEGRKRHDKMTLEDWKKVPGWLDNPALVYLDTEERGKARGENAGDVDAASSTWRLVMIAPEKVQGAPVMMVLQPNATPRRGSKLREFHLLITAYEKDGGDPPTVESLRERGLLRYLNEEKAAEVMPKADKKNALPHSVRANLAGLQLPGHTRNGETPTEEERAHILTPSDLAAWREERAKLDEQGHFYHAGGEAYAPHRARLTIRQQKAVLAAVNKARANVGEAPLKSFSDVTQLTDITELAAGFRALAESAGWTVPEDVGTARHVRANRYFTISKGDFNDAGYVEMSVRVSDHARTSREHAGETDINLVPSAQAVGDQYEWAYDTFESALYKLQNATGNELAEPQVDGEPILRFSRRGQDAVNTPEQRADAMRYGGAGTATQVRMGLLQSGLAQLSNIFRHEGRVSLWDKTVGTPRHLAERVPAFKPVYEAAQQSVEDKAMLANDAAERAKRWIPQMDSWRDIGKQAVSAKDSKAVAKPLFEGTLMWVRDGGKLVRLDELEEKYSKLHTYDKERLLVLRHKMTQEELERLRANPLFSGPDGLMRYEKAIDNRFQKEMMTAGVVFSDDELRRVFHLNERQISLYREARAAIDRSLDMTARADMMRVAGGRYAHLREQVDCRL